MSNSTWLRSIKAETWLALALSLGFFLVKGVRYALIGSLVPLILIMTVLTILALTSQRSPKWFRRSLRYWGILLILWAVGRLLVEVLFKLTPNITEAHIREQFTILQKLVSILFLVIGIHLTRRREIETAT